MNPPYCGAVAQLGERAVRNGEVRGSIPLSSIRVMMCSVGTIIANLCFCPPPFGRTESSNDGVRGKFLTLGN
jgi:hypothetical protein